MLVAYTLLFHRGTSVFCIWRKCVLYPPVHSAIRVLSASCADCEHSIRDLANLVVACFYMLLCVERAVVFLAAKQASLGKAWCCSVRDIAPFEFCKTDGKNSFRESVIGYHQQQLQACGVCRVEAVTGFVTCMDNHYIHSTFRAKSTHAM